MRAATRTILCHYCNGPRPTRSGICLGCGSEAAACERRRAGHDRRCIKCTDGQLVRNGPGGMVMCSGCGYSAHDVMAEMTRGRRSNHA